MDLWLGDYKKIIMLTRNLILSLVLGRRLSIISNNKLKTKSFASTKWYSSASCWKCGLNMGPDKFFCSKCNTVLEPDHKMSFFDVLGVKQKFDIQPTELILKYRQLQNRLHPDKFSGKSQVKILNYIWLNFHLLKILKFWGNTRMILHKIDFFFTSIHF